MTKLPETAFRRADETPDERFYQQPRFVTHIDAGAIAAVTQLYCDYLPAGGAVLDLMSSWVSFSDRVQGNGHEPIVRLRFRGARS